MSLVGINLPPMIFQCGSRRTTRRNDLAVYEQVTRSSGPAMTWAMFSINYLDLNDSIKGDQHFRDGYERNLEPPFLVWREVARAPRTGEMGTGTESSSVGVGRSPGDETEETGAVNFVTGAGKQRERLRSILQTNTFP